jgi:hypothetical protein
MKVSLDDRKKIDLGEDFDADIDSSLDGNPDLGSNSDLEPLDSDIDKTVKNTGTDLGNLDLKVCLNVGADLSIKFNIDLGLDAKLDFSDNSVNNLSEMGVNGGNIRADFEDAGLDPGFENGQQMSLDMSFNVGLDLRLDLGMNLALDTSCNIDFAHQTTGNLGRDRKFDADVRIGLDDDVGANLRDDFGTGIDSDTDQGVNVNGNTTLGKSNLVATSGEGLGAASEEGESHDGRSEEGELHGGEGEEKLW